MLVSVLVCALGFLLHLAPLRMVAIMFAVGFVLVAELFNTAVEAAVDLAMPEHHPLAKRAKDASAGAVLLAAVCAALVGGIVFLPVLTPILIQSPLAIALIGSVLIVLVFAASRSKRAARSRVPDPSSDLSRKMSIGVVLIAFAASGTCRDGVPFAASPASAAGYPPAPSHPVSFSAGVP